MKRTIWILVLTVAHLALACGSDNSKSSGEPFDADVPGQPQNLTVDRIGDGEIWLSWDIVLSEDLAFYIVYRSVGDVEAVALDTTFATDFKDRDLDYEVEYTYSVTAVDMAGNESSPSNTRGGQPFNNLSPLPPTGLRAGAHNIAFLEQLEILLDWDANGEADLDIYRLYRDTEPDFAIGEGNLLTAATEPRFVDLAIDVGTVYYYRVTAVDRGGKESVPSAWTADVALPVPELVEPIGGELTPAAPTFNWRAVPNARNYRVVVTTSPASGEVSDMPLTAATTAVFVGRTSAGNNAIVLQSGQIYWWKLIASTKADGTENSVSEVESFKIR